MTDSRLGADTVSLSYGDTAIVTDLTLAIPDGRITTIVGPNACGKSTLLRGLARLLRPAAGRVLLDGSDIAGMHTKEVARRLGLLPQTSIAPEGITVADLVARGRFPHQKLLRQWSVDDEKAVNEAMTLTGVSELADRLVDELSGGQRQRVWVAMVLAQQTPVLLLDEPTTYLDIAHQVENFGLGVPDPLAGLHDRRGGVFQARVHKVDQRHILAPPPRRLGRQAVGPVIRIKPLETGRQNCDAEPRSRAGNRRRRETGIDDGPHQRSRREDRTDGEKQPQDMHQRRTPPRFPQRGGAPRPPEVH